MPDDIVPSLLDVVQKDFAARLEKSQRAAELLKTITNGKGTYPIASEYAEEVGTALADAFGANIYQSILPDGRMYYNIADRLVRPMMVDDHNLVANASQQVQQTLNNAAGLGIKPQSVPLNESMVDGLVNKLSEATDFDQVNWLLDEPIKTFSRSVVDESIKRNVDFQGKSGVPSRIIRKAESKACIWCREVAGTYEYPDVPDDVYRRHERCRCRLTYYPGDGSKKNVWPKQTSKEKIKARENFKGVDTRPLQDR